MNATRFYVLGVPMLAALLAQPAFAQAHDCLGEIHQPVLTKTVQGWGTLGMDSATAAPGKPPAPLRIGETVYEHGIGHHAPGELVYTLSPGTYTAFTA